MTFTRRVNLLALWGAVLLLPDGIGGWVAVPQPDTRVEVPRYTQEDFALKVPKELQGQWEYEPPRTDIREKQMQMILPLNPAQPDGGAWLAPDGSGGWLN